MSSDADSHLTTQVIECVRHAAPVLVWQAESDLVSSAGQSILEDLPFRRNVDFGIDREDATDEHVAARMADLTGPFDSDPLVRGREERPVRRSPDSNTRIAAMK